MFSLPRVAAALAVASIPLLPTVAGAEGMTRQTNEFDVNGTTCTVTVSVYDDDYRSYLETVVTDSPECQVTHSSIHAEVVESDGTTQEGDAGGTGQEVQLTLIGRLRQSVHEVWFSACDCGAGWTLPK